MSLNSSRNISDLINKFEIKNKYKDRVTSSATIKFNKSNKRNCHYQMNGHNNVANLGYDSYGNNLQYSSFDNGTTYADGDIDDSEMNDQFVDNQLVISRCSYSKSENRSFSKTAYILSRISAFLEMLSRFPLPGLSITGMGILSLITIFICPRTFCELFLYPAFRLLFGTLYPAYASYKAVRTKNVKEYVSKKKIIIAVFYFIVYGE
jgi:hypothetical protein